MQVYLYSVFTFLIKQNQCAYVPVRSCIKFKNIIVNVILSLRELGHIVL